MINCRNVEEKLPDFITGQVDTEIRNIITKHLETCENCRNRYIELKEVDNAMNGKSETEPFKKVKNEIDKQKKKKRMAIILAIIAGLLLLMLVIGEVIPQSGIPSITRLTYMMKARSIAQDFSNNNMEPILAGVANAASGTNGYSYTKADVVKPMLVDYTNELSKIYDEYLKGKNLKVKSSWVSYNDKVPSYVWAVHPENDDYMGSSYNVTVTLSVDNFEFEMVIRFYNKTDYEVVIQAYGKTPKAQIKNEEDIKIAENIDRMNMYVEHFHHCLLSDADDKQFMLNDRMAEVKKHMLLNSTEYVPLSPDVFTLDCHNQDDEAYTNELNQKLAIIRDLCITSDIDMQIRDYNNEKHALNIQMIWQLQDKNGHKAVFTKAFQYGPYGYQKMDDSSEIVAEEGFSMEIKEKLEDLF